MVYALDINPDNFAPARFTNIASLVNIILPILTLGAALIFLAMGLYGAFIWVTAGGSQENLAKAQKIFVSAILGLVIVVFAFVFVQIIGKVLGIQTMF